METPFWVAGAVESMNIGIIVIGPSNKSGPHCMHAIKAESLNAKSERRCDLEVIARGERSLFGIFGPLAHPIASCRFPMKFVPACARQCWHIPIVRGKCGLREAQPLTLFVAPQPHPACSWPWLIPPARDRTRWKSTSRLLGRQHWALPTRRTPSSTVCGSHGARPYGFAQANGRTSAKPPRAPQPLSTVKICNLFRAQGSEALGVTSSLAE